MLPKGQNGVKMVNHTFVADGDVRVYCNLVKGVSCRAKYSASADFLQLSVTLLLRGTVYCDATQSPGMSF